MSSSLPNRAPTVAVFLVLLAVMFLAVYFGRRMGVRDRETFDGDSRTQVSGLQGAVVGLLALLLGFTYSLAVIHFQTNRDMVVVEANAIKTAFLRADIALEPERSALKELLRRYAETRIEFYRAGIDPERREAVDAESERLQAEMWRLTAVSAARGPTCTVATLVEAVNLVIDLHASRLDAARNHVPAVILWLLALMSIASTGLIGYVAGFGNRELRAPIAIVLVLIALVIGMIMGLDRPMRGLIQGGQESMLQLRRGPAAVAADALRRRPSGGLQESLPQDGARAAAAMKSRTWRVDRLAPAPAREDAVVARARDGQMPLPLIGQAPTEIERSARLTEPRDVVLLTLDRHDRGSRDRLGRDALAAHVPQPARQQVLLEHDADAVHVVLGRHVDDGVVLVVEAAVLFGVVVRTPHEIPIEIHVRRGMPHGVHGDEPRVLKEAPDIDAAAPAGIARGRPRAGGWSRTSAAAASSRSGSPRSGCGACRRGRPS